MKKIALSFFLSLLLTACNLPAGSFGKTPTPNVTQAYQTIEAQLTRVGAAKPVATTTPVQFTLTPIMISTNQSNSTLTTVLPKATPTPNCDRAAAGYPFDVTIPDGTIFQPNETFTKTWRLVNNGACTWTSDYAIIWFSGELLNASQVSYVNMTVAPGESMDISVDMTAPKEPGVYQSNWKLRNSAGRAFGIGPGGDSPFWVRIEVSSLTSNQPTSTPTAQTAPAVLVTKLVTLSLDESLDLSTLKINQGSSDDITYSFDSSIKKHTLNTLQNAVLGSALSSTPTYSVCQPAALESVSQTLDDLPASTYFCFRNHNDQYGWIRYITIDSASSNLTLEILTWTAQ